jgi:hypothetical protein
MAQPLINLMLSAVKFKSLQYQLLHGILFRKKYDGLLLRFLEKQDVEKALNDMHDELAGGHFFGRHNNS